MVTSGMTPPLCRRKSLMTRLFDSAAEARASMLVYLRPAIGNPSLALALEGAVASRAGSKARSPRQRLARGDHLEPATHFIGDRFVFRKVPLSQRRQAVRA